MPAAVNVVSMTLTKEPDKKKLDSFHIANTSDRHISSQPQFFIIGQTRA